MRHVILMFLALPFLAFSQTPRSEIIKYISYNKIKGEKLIQNDSIILQINERMGDYDAEISIPYTKGDKVSIDGAWIEDMQGNVIRKLKQKEIIDRSHISDFSLYEDNFIKSFELKHNTYPYRVIYSYKIIYSKFLDIVSLDYRSSKQTIRSGQIIVETEQDNPIKYRQKNIHSPKIDTISNTIKYTWDFKYQAPLLSELKSSPNTVNAPIIHAAPMNFKYGIAGSRDSWITFGNWFSQLNEDKDKLPLSEQEKIKTITSNLNSDLEKAKALYKYMQDNTRYINVSINLGGIQTYPAAYVCTNRYGDCKALTNYMQAMLKYIGIKSYFTLINADNRIVDIDQELPTQIFNHAILTIPLSKDTIYLECTSKNTPFGYIGTSIQGRKALLIDKDNSHFVNLPLLTPKDVECTRHFFVDTSTSKAKLYAVDKGYSYELSNHLSTGTNKNVVDKYIRNNILRGSYDLIDFMFEDNPDNQPTIGLKASCMIHNLYKEYGKNLVLSSFPISIISYEVPNNRTTSVQLDYPEYYKDTIEYDVSGRNIKSIPQNIEIKSDFGEYNLKFEIKDNKFAVNKSILILSGRYSAEQYSDFYKFMVTVKNNENKSYYLELY